MLWAKVYWQRSVSELTNKRTGKLQGWRGWERNERARWLTRSSNLTSDTQTRAKKRGWHTRNVMANYQSSLKVIIILSLKISTQTTMLWAKVYWQRSVSKLTNKLTGQKPKHGSMCWYWGTVKWKWKQRAMMWYKCLGVSWCCRNHCLLGIVLRCG